tara:strand:+ start:190 stop:639 length:450 start_codon:yes stop_codon:yes gene_type:complete
MLGIDGDANTGPRRECSRDLAPARFQRLHKAVENCVGNVFVKNAIIAAEPQVKFQRRRPQYALSGDVFDGERGEAGLPDGWANTGELLGTQRDGAIMVKRPIRESPQAVGGLRDAAQQRQPIEVTNLGNVCYRYLSAVSAPLMALYGEC